MSSSVKDRAKSAGVSMLKGISPMPSFVLDTYVSFGVGSKPPPDEVEYVAPGAHCPETLSRQALEAKATQPGIVRLVFISDTHERHRLVQVPKGDVFVHCGDILMASSLAKDERGERILRDFDEWLQSVPCEEKVVVGGNHDIVLKKHPGFIQNARLLHDCLATLEAGAAAGLKIYGNSFSEGDTHNGAWQDALSVSSSVVSADIVVSHECADPLKERVLKELGCRPRVWASGHRHDEHGVHFSADLGTLFVNAAIQTGSYKPSQRPIVVDLEFGSSALAGGAVSAGGGSELKLSDVVEAGFSCQFAGIAAFL